MTRIRMTIEYDHTNIGWIINLYYVQVGCRVEIVSSGWYPVGVRMCVYPGSVELDTVTKIMTTIERDHT